MGGAKMCRITKHFIILGDGTKMGYDIEKKVLDQQDWLSHLREKRWFTRSIEIEFLRVVRLVCPTAAYLPENMQ